VKVLIGLSTQIVQISVSSFIELTEKKNENIFVSNKAQHERESLKLPTSFVFAKRMAEIACPFLLYGTFAGQLQAAGRGYDQNLFNYIYRSLQLKGITFVLG
jgi:hypothetical protein